MIFKIAKMRHNLAKIWLSIVFPGELEFNHSSEGPLQGAKMTVMDMLEFRDINGPAPMQKSGVMRSNKVRWAISPLPLFMVKQYKQS